MNEKYKRLGKDIFIFFLGTLGSKIILFLLVPLYTNMLSQSEYGTAELVFTVGQLLVPCVSLTIYDAVFRFGLMKDKNRGEVIYVALVVFLVGSLVTIVISPILSLYKSISSYAVYVVLYVISSFGSSTMLSYLYAKQMKKIYALLTVIQALSLVGFNLLLLVVLRAGIQGYLLSNIFSCVLIGVLACCFGRVGHDIKGINFNKDLCKEMVAYSAPLVINSVSWWAIHSSDKIMIELMIGSSFLGLYTVASKIPSLLNVVTTIFNQAWGLASIREYDSTNDKRVYSEVFSYFSSVIFISFFAICVILRPFMRLYVGNEFYDAWKYVPVLLLSACFTAFSAFLGAFFTALKKSKKIMFTTLFAGFVNVAANYLLIPFIGVYGATIGTLISYVVITAVRMFGVKKDIPIAYNLKRFISLSVLSLVVAIIYSTELQSIYTTFLCLLLFVIIDFKNYKAVCLKISSLLKGFRTKKKM